MTATPQKSFSTQDAVNFLASKDPMLAQIVKYFQDSGVFLKDDGKIGTVPSNPTLGTQYDTSKIAQDTARETQDANRMAFNNASLPPMA